MLGSPRLAALCFAAALAFVVLPCASDIGFDGVPLSALQIASGGAIGLMALLWLPARGDRWLASVTLVLAALCLGKLALALAVPSVGALAVCRGEIEPGQPIERSTEFGWTEFTRVDRRLELSGDGFPLHFFNNSERYNCYKRGENNKPNEDHCQLDRDELPFSVAWHGFVHVPAASSYRFWLESEGVASLSLDGEELLTANGRGGERVDRIAAQLEPGWRRLDVTFTAELPEERQIRASWDYGGQRRTLGAPELMPAPVAEWRLALQPLGSRLAEGLTVVAGLCGAFIAWRVGRTLRQRFQQAADRTARLALLERALLVLILAVCLIAALERYRPLEGGVQILPGGEDPLAYETYARDIGLNGPLMTLGKALGKGNTYHFQPGYPYVLALFHALAGEGLFGPFLIQFCLLGASGVALYLLARRLFGLSVAIVTLLLFEVLRRVELHVLPDALLSESVYVALVPISLLLLTVHQQSGQRVALIGGALLFGLAAVVRATAMMVVPFLLLGTLLARWRRDGPTRSLLTTAALLGLVLLPVLLVPLRNQIVAGEAALTAGNAAVTMRMEHNPSKKVDLSGIDDDPLYDALDLETDIRKVLEYIRQDPLGYLEDCRRLAAYSLGFAREMNRRDTTHWLLVALWILYLGGIALDRRARGVGAMALHALVLTHFLAMIVFVPNAYGYRQVLPMYLMLLPIAAIPPAFLARLALRALRTVKIPPRALRRSRLATR